MSASEKKRIVALNKMVRVARAALERLDHHPVARDALDEILRLDLQTKPTPLAGLVGHERASR